MSKRKKNYPDPAVIVQSYGADALRSALCLRVCMCVCELFYFFPAHACVFMNKLCVGGRIAC